MRMSQRFPKILREWAILGGWLILLHVGLFLGWILVERLPGVFKAILFVLYIGSFAIMYVVFYTRLVKADATPDHDEARAHGLPALAKVLDIERTNWYLKTRRYHPIGVPQRREHIMRVRVSRPDAPDYEGTMAEYLYLDQAPKKGATIPVKVHPDLPEVIVLDRDKMAEIAEN